MPADGPPWGCPGSPWHPVEPEAPRPTWGGGRKKCFPGHPVRLRSGRSLPGGSREGVHPGPRRPLRGRRDGREKQVHGTWTCPRSHRWCGGARGTCVGPRGVPPSPSPSPHGRASVITCAPGIAECGLSPRHLPTQSRMYVGPSPSAPHPLPSHWDGLATPGHPHQLQSGGRASAPARATETGTFVQGCREGSFLYGTLF